MEEQVIARIDVSTPRRALGVGMLLLLGGLLIYLALKAPPGLGWQLFLLALGGAALALAEAMRRATARALVLTEEGLFEEGGEVLAPLAQIRAIDRGFMAFKPSNGFVLTLAEKAERRWAPGVWWRLGRRVGVGGVTGAGQTKFAAEALQAMIARRG